MSKHDYSRTQSGQFAIVQSESGEGYGYYIVGAVDRTPDGDVERAHHSVIAYRRTVEQAQRVVDICLRLTRTPDKLEMDAWMLGREAR